MQISDLFVVAMGIGVVFIVLILIIVLCSLLGAAFKNVKDEKPAQSAAPAADNSITNRAELAAAIAAAVAEYTGTDASALRILSIKKL